MIIRKKWKLSTLKSKSTPQKSKSLEKNKISSSARWISSGQLRSRRKSMKLSKSNPRWKWISWSSWVISLIWRVSMTKSWFSRFNIRKWWRSSISCRRSRIWIKLIRWWRLVRLGRRLGSWMISSLTRCKRSIANQVKSKTKSKRSTTIAGNQKTTLWPSTTPKESPLKM